MTAIATELALRCGMRNANIATLVSDARTRFAKEGAGDMLSHGCKEVRFLTTIIPQIIPRALGNSSVQEQKLF